MDILDILDILNILTILADGVDGFVGAAIWQVLGVFVYGGGKGSLEGCRLIGQKEFVLVLADNPSSTVVKDLEFTNPSWI